MGAAREGARRVRASKAFVQQQRPPPAPGEDRVRPRRASRAALPGRAKKGGGAPHLSTAGLSPPSSLTISSSSRLSSSLPQLIIGPLLSIALHFTAPLCPCPHRRYRLTLGACGYSLTEVTPSVVQCESKDRGLQHPVPPSPHPISQHLSPVARNPPRLVSTPWPLLSPSQPYTYPREILERIGPLGLARLGSAWLGLLSAPSSNSARHVTQ